MRPSGPKIQPPVFSDGFRDELSEGYDDLDATTETCVERGTYNACNTFIYPFKYLVLDVSSTKIAE